jgi:chromosome segregation ATPase
MHRVTIERRLRDAHERLVRARDELAVLDEQLAVVNEIADDTRIKALVAETPLAAKEHDEASRHASALLRTREALAVQIADLERRQDELLDRLVISPD